MRAAVGQRSDLRNIGEGVQNEQMGYSGAGPAHLNPSCLYIHKHFPRRLLQMNGRAPKRARLGSAAASSFSGAGVAAPTACVWGDSCDHTCMYHQWVRTHSFAGLGKGIKTAFSLRESYKRLLVSGVEATRKAAATSRQVPVRTGQFRRVAACRPTDASDRAESKSEGVAVARMAGFLRLLEYLGTAPWASATFSTNARMISRLVVSHMAVIVGVELAKTHKEALISFVDTDGRISDAQNTVWITNRQQGKTSTLGKFIAALAIYSPRGGLVATIYSTGLDRAVELVKAAKAYIHWMKADADGPAPHKGVVFARDNERSFTLRTAEGALNEIAARPRNVDSCRGDAPACAFFDEAAFMSETFWYQFAYPLLQVKNRVFTCTTTPPPEGNYFAKFADTVKAQNAKGNTFFTLINHALACEECIAKGIHEDCTHQLHLIPPWKSLLRMTHMATLVPAGRKREFQAEVYGVCHKEEGNYFRPELVDAMLTRKRLSRPPIKDNTVYIAVDPGSHQKSEMAIVALGLHDNTGQTVILGLSAIKVARFEAFHVQAIVHTFVKRLALNLAYFTGDRTFVPIIECNNNEVIAMSIKTALDKAVTSVPRCRAVCPFVSAAFKKNITTGLGVWTTEGNKLASVQEMQTLLLEGRIAVATPITTVTRACVDAGASVSGPSVNHLSILRDQLTRIKDDPRGKISGKTAHGDEDDLAIALLIGVYWSAALRQLRQRRPVQAGERGGGSYSRA